MAESLPSYYHKVYDINYLYELAFVTLVEKY